jgi:hypothetical protein
VESKAAYDSTNNWKNLFRGNKILFDSFKAFPFSNVVNKIYEFSDIIISFEFQNKER